MSNCTNNFIKRVIGVTRTFQWTITTNGAAVPLVADDLTLQLVPPRGEAVSLPFDVDDNIVSFTWQGEDQHIIGCYSLILWANYGEDNQRRVDIHNFVELIPWSDRQSGEYSDLVEETIELETADFGENIMVVDNLNSTSATDALSANMGRQLNVTKQDVIQDLATIRSGAAAGAAVKEWAKNDPLITDDGTQVSASKLAFNGNLFEQWVPGIASSIGLKGIAGFLKLADISQWDSAYNDRMLPTVAAVKAKLQAVLTALGTIEAVIPSQASSTNKLTDKDYVDGAIATNTANFVGTFDTLAELQAVPNPTKNDYGFVIEQDAQGNEYYDRYKYTGTQWLYEYKVESTPFTTEQWAAIQSGITAALVTKLSALPTNAELNTALAGKQPVIDDLTTIRSGAAAGATAYQKPSTGIPKTDLAAAVQTSLGKADAAAPQSTTYTKTEVDAALALKQTSSQLATINGSRIDQGGNVTIIAAEGQTITIDAAPTAGSNNAVSSGGVWENINALGIGISALTEYTDTGNLQISSSNYYVTVASPNTGRFYPIVPGKQYKITPRTGLGTIIAILQNINNVRANVRPAFSALFNSRVAVSAGNTYEFICPDDAYYLYMISQPTSSTYDIGTIETKGSLTLDVESLDEDIQYLKALFLNTKVYSKAQLQEPFVYNSNKLFDATNSMGKSIGQVTQTNATPPAYIFKIPIQGACRIKYPVFLTSSGYGCLVTNASDIVIAQYANATLQSGTIKEITTPDASRFFYFSAPSSITNLTNYEIEIVEGEEPQTITDMYCRVGWLPFFSELGTESNNSLCLAAIKTRILNNKIPFHSGFLFHKLPDDDGKIFFGTKLDNAVEVGTLDYQPKDYVLAVSPKDGTVIAVARDQRLPIRVFNGTNHTVDAKSSDNNVSPKGWLYNSGVDFINVNGTEYCIFAEYDGTSTNNQTLHIWKGTYPYTSPSNWKTVFSKTTSYNPVVNGTITHFHMIRRDPWTNILYCTTGDFTRQFFWLYSTDNGETWNTLATDFDNATKPSWVLDGQPLRCINFIFTEDYIYFATDHGSNNTLSRISRNSSTGVIDIDTREVLANLPYGVAVNTLCYVETPNGLLMFTRIDTGFTTEYSKPVPVLFYSFKDETLHTIALLKRLTNDWGGHRGKCYMNYTNGQEPRPAMGFAGNTPCQFELVGANGNNIGTIFYDL